MRKESKQKTIFCDGSEKSRFIIFSCFFFSFFKIIVRAVSYEFVCIFGYVGTVYFFWPRRWKKTEEKLALLIKSQTQRELLSLSAERVDKPWHLSTQKSTMITIIRIPIYDSGIITEINLSK